MDNDNKPAKFCYPYPHAAITADCIVFGYDPNKTLRVLLVKRRNEPYKDCWAFPGGFMEIDEDLETCARREVMEETGMALGEVFQFRSYSAVDRDPRERVITVVHFAFDHTREYCQLLVGVFAGNILFVTASGYKLFIIFYDFFDNHGCLLLGLWGAGVVLHRVVVNGRTLQFLQMQYVFGQFA